MKDINLIFVVSTANHLFFVNALKEELLNRSTSPKILCLHFDEWYHLNLEKALENSGLEHASFERIDKNGKNIWSSSERIWNEADLERLENFFLEINTVFSTDILVFFTDDGIFESTLIKLCNSKNINTLFIQESSYIMEILDKTYLQKFVKYQLRSFKNFLRKRKDESVRPFGLNGCKYMSVTNSKSYKYFYLYGYRKPYMQICGHLLMDKLWKFKNRIPGSVKQKNNKKQILIISSGWINFGIADQHKWVVEQLRFFVDRFKDDFSISMRLKNGENINVWKDIWPEVENVIEIKSYLEGMYEQIVDADLVITNNSQAIIEALMLDVPVINLIPKEREELWPLGKNKVISNVRSGNELVECFQQPGVFELTVHQKRKINEIFNDFYFAFDGKASARVCDFIENTILS